jgi:excisionase family DNA binding protein
MKFLSTPPAPVLDAATTLLSPYMPGLTASMHVAALKGYRPDAATKCKEPPPRMLSLEEAAESLAVSICTVRRMAKDGRLPGRKVGNLWRIPAAAVKVLAEVGEG